MASDVEDGAIEFLPAAPEGETAGVQAMLREAEVRVAEMVPSAAERRLRQALSIYRRVVDSWSHAPPSARQAAFVQGLVEDVLREANQESPTVRLRRPA